MGVSSMTISGGGRSVTLTGEQMKSALDVIDQHAGKRKRRGKDAAAGEGP